MARFRRERLVCVSLRSLAFSANGTRKCKGQNVGGKGGFGADMSHHMDLGTVAAV